MSASGQQPAGSQAGATVATASGATVLTSAQATQLLQRLRSLNQQQGGGAGGGEQQTIKIQVGGEDRITA